MYWWCDTCACVTGFEGDNCATINSDVEKKSHTIGTIFTGIGIFILILCIVYGIYNVLRKKNNKELYVKKAQIIDTEDMSSIVVNNQEKKGTNSFITSKEEDINPTNLTDIQEIWIKEYDENSNSYYYYNSVTYESIWESEYLERYI